ncbi:hypothetical protein D3C77_445600 [compost metagenome]
MATVTHGANHCAGVFIGAHRRHPRWHYTEHGLAQAQLDGGSGAPDHAHRRAAAQVDHFGKVDGQAQVLGGHGRHEHRSFMKVRAVDHQTIEVFGTQPGVAQRLRGQVGDLFEVEHARCSGILFRLVLRGAYNRRMTFKTHVSPTRKLCASVFCCVVTMPQLLQRVIVHFD